MGWRRHAPTAPTHHLQTETDHRGREVASVGVGTPDPKRGESHDFSRAEDVNVASRSSLDVDRGNSTTTPLLSKEVRLIGHRQERA
ncbi:hypothetical protein [Haladaptatus sp. NG-SE-30]